MRDGLKHLIDLASVDLAYARAEIALSVTMGEEKERTERHLVAAARLLNRIAREVPADEGARGSGHAGKTASPEILRLLN